MNNVLKLVKNQKPKTIVFFHIPKTAGTNFTYIIDNNYKYDYKKDNFQYIDRKTKKPVCVFGHHGFQAYNRLTANYIYFIFLRNPVERVISHFVEHKRNGYTDTDLTLDEIFLEKPDKFLGCTYPDIEFSKRAGFNGNAPWASNFYCRALSGSGFVGKNPWPITQNLCNNVKKSLLNNELIYTSGGQNKKVPVIVGITEQFATSIKLFAKIAGWKTIAYKEESRLRAYNNGKRRCEVSDETVQEIKKYNMLDMQIYNTARVVFNKQLDFFNEKK